MDEAKVRQILKGIIGLEDKLCDYAGDRYIRYDGNDDICLDGYFDADTMEALAWWIRNKGLVGK